MADLDREAIANMRAITVSREYGSGGGEIAALLAKRLGWRLVDHEVIVRIARKLGVSEKEAAEYDESADDLPTRILHSLRVIQPTMPITFPVTLTTGSRAYNEARCRVIEEATEKGHLVIVGRGAQILLAKRRDVLHTRFVAPLEERIAYVMGREGLDHAAAQARIQLKDQDRIRFLQTEHHHHPADARLYDLVVNTNVLDLESAVDLALLALERKARRLAVATGALGPGVGLPPYPGKPEDFRPQ